MSQVESSLQMSDKILTYLAEESHSLEIDGIHKTSIYVHSIYSPIKYWTGTDIRNEIIELSV